MIIHPVPSGPFSTNAYVVACEVSKKAIVLDPSPGSAERIANYVKSHKYTVTEIVLTHSHWDHIVDTAKVKELFGVPVAVHPLDRGNLERPGSDGVPCWLEITPVTPDRLLNEGDTVTCGNDTFAVIHTPGHCPGSICLYCAESGVLISGDTLFQGSIGNLSLATGEPEKMWGSLAKLAILPPATKVYPGHGGSTTIGAESWLPRAREVFGDD